MEVPNPKRQKREGDRENDHLANAEDKIDLKTAQKDEEFFLNSAGNVEIASSVQKIQNMFLRRIVKENHGTTILQCAFYSRQLGDFKGTDGMGCNSSNLVATVCASQLNIYDNQHCGDHLDLISQFTTSDIRCSEIPNPEFTCFSWIYSDDDDALVAVAGSHSIVHIISLSRSEELCRLRGHRGSVVDLQCHQIERRLLMSLCKEDSSIRGWDTSSAECIYLLDVSATAMCFNSEGSRLLVAQTVESTTQIIQIPFVRAKDSGKEGSPRLAHCIVTGEDCPCIQSYRRVDHMRYVSGNVLVKSPLGLELLHTESNKVIRTFPLQIVADDCRSRLDISADQRFVCIGGSSGDVSVFDIDSGSLVKSLRHKRSNNEIRCCTFSLDLNYIVCAGENALVWRYDYVSDERIEKWKRSSGEE